MCNNQSCQASLALAHSITLVCYGDDDDEDKEDDGLPAYSQHDKRKECIRNKYGGIPTIYDDARQG